MSGFSNPGTHRPRGVEFALPPVLRHRTQRTYSSEWEAAVVPLASPVSNFTVQ
jgi:hypothetical protein